MTDIPLRVMLSVVGGGAVAAAVEGLAGALGPASMIDAALAGFTAVSVKASADFQTAMLSNVAHAGLAKEQYNSVSQAILAMAPTVGRAPTQLAEAMYPILSAFSGITNQSAKSALALTTLKLSMEAVAGTTVDGTAVANAAVGTFNALGLSTNNAAVNAQRMSSLMDVMDKTVQLGNMQWQAYQGVISKLAVSIQGTGIKFNEASAALATMTNEGYSAQRAQTYLSNLFTTIAIKTDALAKHAKKLGISFDEAKYGPMTLAEKIQYLNQITGGNKQELLALMGNNATALKSFNALSTGLSGYKSNLDALNHSHGALATSFAIASQGFNFHVEQLKAAFDSLEVSIGTLFLPLLTAIVGAITPVVTAMATWVATNDGVTVSIMNASSGMMPAIRQLTVRAMQLSQALGWFVVHATMPLIDQFTRAAGVTRNQFLPSLQSTATWMQGTGTPVYEAFAQLVRDVVGGSFLQARADALSLAVTTSEVLSGLPGQIKIGMPTAPGVGSMFPGFAQLSRLADQIKQWLQPVIDWLDGPFLAGWHAVFDPIGQMIQQVETDMGPQFQQFFQFMEDTVFADFGSGGKGSTSVGQFNFSWKDLLHTIGQLIEIFLKFWIYCSEFVIPIVLKVDSVVMWLAMHLAGPALRDLQMHLQFWQNLIGYINTTIMPAFGNLMSFLSGFFSWLPGATGEAVGSVLGKFGWLKDQAWQMIQSIIGFWRVLPQDVGIYVSMLIVWLTSRFVALKNAAFHWGQDLINLFVQGVQSAFGNLQNTINNIGNWIKAHLGFSVPSAGPLATANQWMPDMMDLFSRGIVAGSPKLQASLNAAISPFAATLAPSGTGSTRPNVPVAGHTTIINISLSTLARTQADVRNLVDLIEQELGRRVRGQTAGYNTGGIF